MLVRNLTKVTLNVGYGADRVRLEPMKITVVDECKFSAEYLKKLYGAHIQILTEKVAVKNEPKVPEENAGKIVTEENTKGEGANKPADNTGDGDANTPEDDDDMDKLINEVHEELEGENTGDKEETTKGDETPKGDETESTKTPATKGKTAKKAKTSKKK